MEAHFTEAEFVGIQSTFNASPIGDWTIAISPQSTQRQPRSILEDVEIELALAARPLGVGAAHAFGFGEAG